MTVYKIATNKLKKGGARRGREEGAGQPGVVFNHNPLLDSIEGCGIIFVLNTHV